MHFNMFKKQNMDIQVNLRKLFVCGYIEVSLTIFFFYFY